MMRRFITLLLASISKLASGVTITADIAMTFMGRTYSSGGVNSGENIALGRALGFLHRGGHLLKVGWVSASGIRFVEYKVV